MSQPSPSQVDSIISAWPILLLGNYISVATAALYIYDYLLTLPLEISEIWPSKFSGATALYLLNRYPFFAVQILGVVGTLFVKSSDSCDIVNHLQDGLYVLPSIATVAIFALRTFAIYRKNWFVLAVIGSMGVGIVATNVWVLIANSTFVKRPFGPGLCVLVQTPNQSRLANYVLIVAFDSAVFIFTCVKTIRLALAMKKIKSTANLAFLLLRDGTVYYFSALFLGTVDIIIVEIDAVPLQAKCIVIPFVQTLTAVLINRLILNLRQESSGGTDGETFTRKTSLPEPMFAVNPVLGNLGAPLREDSIEEIEDEGEEWRDF